jgi:hypothetical protein
MGMEMGMGMEMEMEMGVVAVGQTRLSAGPSTTLTSQKQREKLANRLARLVQMTKQQLLSSGTRDTRKEV